MRKTITVVTLLLTVLSTVMALEGTMSSPGNRLRVTINDDNGLATYSVSYDDVQVLTASRLGFEADFGDFTKGLTMGEPKMQLRDATIFVKGGPKRQVSATRYTVPFTNAKGQRMSVVFNVTDSGVAYCYEIPRPGENPKCGVIRRETSSFNFPEGTSTFLCPQIGPMTGWERTKPSYEEDYKADQPMAVKSQFGQGYTFPCLFKTPLSSPEGDTKPRNAKASPRGGSEGAIWVLVSETGVDGSYVGSHLSDYSPETGYTIAFPQAGENNGNGTPFAGIPLPYTTPWRTIVIGTSLKPIVESKYGLPSLQRKYEPSIDYKPGRYTWSWLVWQDESINYDDQVQGRWALSTA